MRKLSRRKTTQLQRKRSVRTKTKGKSRSIQLKEVITKEERSFQDDVQRLYDIFSLEEGSEENTDEVSSEKLSAIPRCNTPSSSNIGSEKSLFWDSRADIRTPAKEEDLLDITFNIQKFMQLCLENVLSQ